MISERIINIINEQINREFYSGYLYLSISAYFREIGLFGFAHRTKEQAAEEMEHGMKLFGFIIDRNGKVELKQIATPQFEMGSPVEIYQKIYEHEKMITEAIMDVARFAEEECDRTTLSFIDWYINEQIEEERSALDIIKRLKAFGDDRASLFLMDNELNQYSRN